MVYSVCFLIQLRPRDCIVHSGLCPHPSISIKKMPHRKVHGAWGWGWCTPLIRALERQRQTDLCEFQPCLLYRGSSGTAKATLRNPALILKKEGRKEEKCSQAKLMWVS